MEKIAKMDRRGYTQSQIAAETGLSQPMVSKYKTRLFQRYAQSQLHEKHAQVVTTTDAYMEVICEAFEAWERSKIDTTKVVTTEKDSGSGEGIETSISKTVEGRLPDPRYLDIILRARQALRELHGIDPPKKTQVEAQVLDWNAVLAELPPLPAPASPALPAPNSTNPTLNVVEQKLIDLLNELPGKDASCTAPPPSSPNSNNGNGLHENGAGE